ncbi:helix-hairpin-helix domain-containing protein [Macrococcus animalis]|uniref:helix-hairpin-helix domain-containing protein n=1 Tax=Macrococcus animalis TaxID=3395467 RepID=UPI0039BF0D47
MDFETLKSWIEKNKLLSGCIILIALLLTIIVFQKENKSDEAQHIMPNNQFANTGVLDPNESKGSVLPVNEKATNVANTKQDVTGVKVDIKGAVKFSGVYPAKSNQVVNDIVQLAVPLKNADLDAVNLAATLQDAMVIYIPFKGEVKEEKFSMYQQQIGLSNNSSVEGKQKVVNINTAEQSALEEIPGVGPKKAQEIIQYRESNGGFKSIEEIKEIKGIGDKTYESLKDYISI